LSSIYFPDTASRLIEKEHQLKQKENDITNLIAAVEGRKVDVDKEKSELDKLLSTLHATDTGIWTTHDKKLPFIDFDSRISRRRPIIITVANLKGGVGKTTLVGNLLAYFDQKLKKRVLAIDLDYQGSLSTMLATYQVGLGQTRKSHVDVLLSAGDPLRFWGVQRQLGASLRHSYLCSAFYELARTEDALMIEWLIQKCEDDARYRLASVFKRVVG
jgi:hypothetical protein